MYRSVERYSLKSGVILLAHYRNQCFLFLISIRVIKMLVIINYSEVVFFLVFQII